MTPVEAWAVVRPDGRIIATDESLVTAWDIAEKHEGVYSEIKAICRRGEVIAK